MRLLLQTLTLSATMFCHTAEQQPQQKTDLDRCSKTKILRKLRDTRGDPLITLITQHPFLQAQRIPWSDSIITIGIGQTAWNAKHLKQHIAALVAAGVPIDQENSHGQTALMEMARGVHTKHADTARTIIHTLLRHRASIHTKNDDGYDPLSIALASGYGDNEALLLSCHPELPEIINKPAKAYGKKTTYLDLAIKSDCPGYIRFPELIKNILKAGAHVTSDTLLLALNCPDSDLLIPYCSRETLHATRPRITDDVNASRLSILIRKREYFEGAFVQPAELLENLRHSWTWSEWQPYYSLASLRAARTLIGAGSSVSQGGSLCSLPEELLRCADQRLRLDATIRHKTIDELLKKSLPDKACQLIHRYALECYS